MGRCATQPQSQHHVPIDLVFSFPAGDGGGLNGYSQTGSLWPTTDRDCFGYLSLLTRKEESFSSPCADLTQLADHRQGIQQAANDNPDDIHRHSRLAGDECLLASLSSHQRLLVPLFLSHWMLDLDVGL